VLDGPINAECFLAYVEQILVAVLRDGDTVILDNLSSHKNEDAAASCRRRGLPHKDAIGAAENEWRKS
jgi:hypothetical protein